jgi:6-phosphogluconolactonase
MIVGCFLTRWRCVALMLTAIAATGVIVTARAQAPTWVYVGTYTAATNPKSGSLGIYAFRFDEATGTLSAAGLAGETPSPSFLTASADGRFLFAVNELQTADGASTGLVTSFAINRASGTLSKLSVQQSRGAGPCHLALDKTGRWLAVANYSAGNYALLPVNPDGTLGPAKTVVHGEATTGADGAPLKPLGHMVGFDASNQFLIASDKGLNKLLVFRFDDRSGTLTPNAVPSVTMPQPGSGPRHFAFDRAERFLFSIAEQAATITTFSWNAANGTLTPIGSVPTRPADVTTGSTAEIAAHPFGPFVYGSNRGHNSIAVFRVGAKGDLTLVEHELTRGTTPRSFGLDPAGRWLIAANQGSGSLAVFSIDDRTGALDAVGPLAPLDAPVSVVFVK